MAEQWRHNEMGDEKMSFKAQEEDEAVLFGSSSRCLNAARMKTATPSPPAAPFHRCQVSSGAF